MAWVKPPVTDIYLKERKKSEIWHKEKNMAKILCPLIRAASFIYYLCAYKKITEKVNITDKV